MIGDLEIMEESKLVEGTDYRMCFWYKGHRGGWGYTFDCDKEGNLAPFKCPEAADSYARCLAGKDANGDILKGEIRAEDFSYYTKTVGKCQCGGKIYLANFTNTCDCGRDYNTSGQLLAPRSQWGEETGEHWSDCYSGDLDD